jgi:hypothetical protein
MVPGCSGRALTPRARFLVLTPAEGSGFEYFDESGPAGDVYTAYIHSAASGAELRAKGGTWRQEHTRLTLAPGQSAAYRFRLRWAKDYDGVRDLLCDEGLFDIHVVPRHDRPHRSRGARLAAHQPRD